jgi:spermidine synthase
MLVDRWSAGEPDRAGRAYAVNALGCILGPLLSGFVLLPLVGERWTLVLLSAPFFLLGLVSTPARDRRWQAKAGVAVAAAVPLLALTRDFETVYPGAQVRRDHTATSIATGKGMDRMLLVNGMGITNLTPITKMMAHLPLASLESPPRQVLVLCFGMGTSFRSALSWGVPVTVVELVPSVPSLFGYFHGDAAAVLASPRATVVIDDARRFLERTQESFDAIVIDPPPPVEAAGSSLLYSREFYGLAASRLRPEGILQQWLPEGEPIVVSAMAQALGSSFPHVRVFSSIEGWGLHFLASQTPMTPRTAVELARRLPPAAAADLLEWGPAVTAEAQFQPVVAGETPLQTLIDGDPDAPMLTDDRPVNEYYFLRRTFRKRQPGFRVAPLKH